MAEKDRTGFKQVELSDEEWDQRAAKLAEVEQERIDLIEEKRNSNRMWNEQLIAKRDTIEVLTEEVNTRKAWVPAQTTMFSGGANDTEASSDDEEEPAEEAPRGRRRGRRGGRNAEALQA